MKEAKVQPGKFSGIRLIIGVVSLFVAVGLVRSIVDHWHKRTIVSERQEALRREEEQNRELIAKLEEAGYTFPYDKGIHSLNAVQKEMLDMEANLEAEILAAAEIIQAAAAAAPSLAVMDESAVLKPVMIESGSLALK